MEGRLGGGNMREEWDGVGESRVEWSVGGGNKEEE